MANRVRDLAKEASWRDAFARFAASGLDVRAFCKLERLSEPSFYAWRRELARRTAVERGSAPRATNNAAPRAASKPASRTRTRPARRRPPAFVRAIVTDQPRREDRLALELANGRVLRLPESFSMARLAELLAALEAAPRAPEAAR